MSTYIIYVLALSQILEVINYAQNKRQQNRPKHTTNSVIKTDFASQIAEKQIEKEVATLEAEKAKAMLKLLKNQRRLKRNPF